MFVFRVVLSGAWPYRQLIAALLWLATATLAVADNEIEVALDLYHFAGNLDIEQRDALLASPDWKVSASYSPLVSVPGVTASWAKCGFLQLPCLRDHDEEIVLTGSALRRQGTELRFNLPRYKGVRRFRLSYVNVSLPLKRPDSLSGLSTYFFVTREDGVHVSPVVLEAGAFLLAGTLRMEGEAFRARHFCPDREECWKKIEKGRYEFRPRHRFAFYRLAYLFPDKGRSLQQPLPGELENKKIYRATLSTRQVDGHRIDFVDVSATENRNDCSSDDLQYEILYVDGKPITYSRRMPDPDPGQCRGHYRRIEWGNDGKPITFGGMLVEWINHGSSITYFNWNARCDSVVAGNFSECNIPPPTAVQEAEIKADARRVREWFAAGEVRGEK